MTTLDTLFFTITVLAVVAVFVLVIWAAVCLHSGATRWNSLTPIYSVPVHIDSKEVPHVRIA